MKRLSLILLFLIFPGMGIAAQSADCQTAAASAASILANAETLLAQDNIEGATTLIQSARTTLENCSSVSSDAAPEQTSQATATGQVTPVPTETTVSASSTTASASDDSTGNFTVNAPSVSEEQGIAFIHFAHTSVDVGAIDLYMNNTQQPVVANLNYGEATDLIWIRSGGHTITARPAGSGINGEQLYRMNWNYVSNSSWVVIAAGVQDRLAFIVEPISIIRNDYSGQGRVRVVNLIAGGPRLTVQDESGRVYGNRLGWIGLNDTRVPGGTYNLTATTADNRTTNSPFEINITPETTITLLAMGRGTDEQPVTFLQLTDARNQTRIRFTNNSARPIEIYMRPGNEQLVEMLDPGAETDYIPLASGAATFISYEPGTGPTGRELAALPWQLRPGRDMTIQIGQNSMSVQDISLRNE